MIKKTALCLTTALLLGACSSGWFSDDKEAPPLPGDRVSILELQQQLQPDSEVRVIENYSAPKAWANEYWPQAGGYPNHSMQNLAFSENEPKQIWSTDIGEGTASLPLTAQPVVVGGKIFALDTRSQLSAYNIKNGDRLWSVNARKVTEDDDPVITGGIAFSGGVLYVTPGYNEVLAVNPEDGKIFWRAPLNSPSRAAPSILDGRVFVTTLSNSVQAFNAKDGTMLWTYEGIQNDAGILGAASPAANGSLVIPGFSSGEVYALRVENGSVAWSDNLAGVLRLGGLGGLSDIRGLPVVDKGLVYAISFGGKMAAIDERTGTRVWARDIGGSETPWISGSHLFVITGNSEVVALNRETGAIAWVSQLARYEEKETKSGHISWTGPIMAGGRLLAFSADGRAAEISPADGKLIRQWRTERPVRIPPVVAGGTLYLLAEDGSLMAYK